MKTPENLNTRFIFVAGGVMSGIGKGVTVASTGRILKDYGFRVTAVKIDPYLNVDAGTMNPTEHGEVFVTDDGMETDQDIGNYERFLNQDILRANYMTAGLVYKSVIEKERALHYGGKCVEVIPHVTDEIQERLIKAARKNDADFVLVEIGGTVGETQNELFLHVARIMKLQMPGKVFTMLVSYFPIPSMIGEMKTKPTQQAVQLMQAAGVQPDFIIARSSQPLDDVRKQKVSVFCNVDSRDIISAPDISSIYEVPVNFEKDNLGKRILQKCGLVPKARNFGQWRQLVRNIKEAKEPVRIGIVGKYFGTGDFTLSDSYLSVIEAIKHAAAAVRRKPLITWLNAETYEKPPLSAGPRQRRWDPGIINELSGYDGIIVPGGFGARGVEGKIQAIKYCRENNIPFLGLCYGLQLATIEFARNVCGLDGAHTTEVNGKTRHPVIYTMADQVAKLATHQMGGSMRLGAYDCILALNSKSYKLYGMRKISERHRHRYEVNNGYAKKLQDKGLLVAGTHPKLKLVEIIELPDHPYFIASQFHPELKSRPLHPHPLFRGLIKAAVDRQKKRA